MKRYELAILQDVAKIILKTFCISYNKDTFVDN